MKLYISKLILGTKSEKKSNGVWSVLFFMNVLCDLFKRLKDIINFRLFSLKINLLQGIIELTL